MQSDKKSSVIIIPVLNPDANLNAYIGQLIDQGFIRILVVNDGSDASLQHRFDEIGKRPECTILTHEKNQGKGKALKDALKYYQAEGLAEEYEGVITVDADGQHAVDDVIAVSGQLRENREALILGERAFDGNVPFRSRFGNNCTKYIFRLLYGQNISDTQTGLRGIPNKWIPDFMELEGERYEYEMNMLIACSRKKIPVKSVGIRTIYLEENSSSHFHPIKDSWKIYKLIIKNFFTFMLSSLSASIIDIGLFQLLIILLRGGAGKYYIAVATVVARIISSFYNFTVNHKLVFKSDHSVRQTIIRYYCLCVVQMALSAAFVTVGYQIFPLPEIIVKIIVDTILFVISYRVQKGFVF